MRHGETLEEEVPGIGTVEILGHSRAKRLLLKRVSRTRVRVTIPLMATPEQAIGLALQYKGWLRKEKEHFVGKEEIKLPEEPLVQEVLMEKFLNKITKKAEALAKKFGLEHNKILITKTTGRWGSCNAKKDLRFSLYLAFVPEDLQDYVVVHELAHTKYMDHSPAFWNFVELMCPNARAKHEQLKNYIVV